MITDFLQSAGMTHVGMKRKHNEDACLHMPEHALFVVADGMGGAAGGDLASQEVTEKLQSAFGATSGPALGSLAERITLFRTASDDASGAIRAFVEKNSLGQMGSTVVGLLFDLTNPRAAVALHAGDSRLYQLRDGKLKVVTEDHSAVAYMAAKLGRDPASFPSRYQNELMRAVGLKRKVELERTRVSVASGDLFLLCSDGLCKMMDDETIRTYLLKAADLGKLAQTLVKAANDAGGKDNVTVILIRIGDVSSFPEPVDPVETLPVAAVVLAEERDDGATRSAEFEEVTISETPAELESITPDAADPLDRSREHAPRAMDAISDTNGKKRRLALVAVLAAVVLGASFFILRTPAKRPASPDDLAVNVASTNGAAPPAKGSEEGPVDRKMAALLQSAGEAIDRKDWAGAQSNAEALLAIKPANIAAQGIVDRARREVDAEAANVAFSKNLAAAKAALSGGVWTQAMQNAAAALAIRADDAEAKKILAQAREAQTKRVEAEIQREQKFEGALEAGRAALASGDFATAAQKASEALTQIPGQNKAVELKAAAGQGLEIEKQFKAALTAAQTAAAQSNWNETLAQAEAALKVKPNDPLAIALRVEARKQTDSALEKERALVTMLTAARQAEKEGQWDQAVAKANEALKYNQTNPDAQRIRDAALGELAKIEKRKRELATAVGAAKAAFSEGRFADAITAADAALKLKPDSVELLKVRDEAQSKLTAARLFPQEAAKVAAAGEPIPGDKKVATASEATASAVAPSQQIPAKVDVSGLDGEFQVLLVQFGVKVPKDYITFPKAREAKRLSGRIVEPQVVQDRVKRIEEGFKSQGLIDATREALLVKLRKAIDIAANAE